MTEILEYDFHRNTPHSGLQTTSFRPVSPAIQLLNGPPNSAWSHQSRKRLLRENTCQRTTLRRCNGGSTREEKCQDVLNQDAYIGSRTSLAARRSQRPLFLETIHSNSSSVTRTSQSGSRRSRRSPGKEETTRRFLPTNVFPTTLVKAQSSSTNVLGRHQRTVFCYTFPAKNESRNILCPCSVNVCVAHCEPMHDNDLISSRQAGSFGVIPKKPEISLRLVQVDVKFARSDLF